jgi:5-methylcytosine-specific restriction endonuclease McrA
MQKWVCWWGAPGCAGYCKDEYDVDHIVPLDRGGHNDPSNIVISCSHCNRSKQDKLPEEWIRRLF